MSCNIGYYKSEVEFDGCDRSFKKDDNCLNVNEDKYYSLNEALNIAGTGRYSITLMAVTALSILSMSVEMFGFSVIIGGARCEFQLSLSQKSALLSMPFIGPVVMSYWWGYLSDTQGRRKSLLIAMWGSFVVSALSALSPHYVVTGLLKFVSTSLCSCAQSTGYALLGEGCSQKARGPLMLLISSTVHFCPITYFILAYYILNNEVLIHLGSVAILPWRILVLVLAIPLGLSALCLHYIYESPKFLASVGRSDEALVVLRKMWCRNGNKGPFPVKKLIFEEGNTNEKQSLLKSMWQQTAPLFEKPLLLQTLKLYYLITILYSITNSVIMWLPSIAEAFFSARSRSTHGEQNGGLCEMIGQAQNNNISYNSTTCTATLDLETVYFGVGQSLIFFVVTVVIAVLASRKKILMQILLLVSVVSGVGVVLSTNHIVSFMLFMGLLVCVLCMGIVFSYFVDLYPTSHRSMVACLGTIIARASGLVGVNVIGLYMMSHCSITIYACSAYVFSGFIVTYFLPPDRPKTLVKVITNR